MCQTLQLSRSYSISSRDQDVAVTWHPNGLPAVGGLTGSRDPRAFVLPGRHANETSAYKHLDSTQQSD